MADDTIITSLESYDAIKIINAINAFYDNVRKFDDVANKITVYSELIKAVWEGPAGEMFYNKYETVYGQVVDISDSLYQIYDMLQKAQDAFYQADDQLALSMKEATSKGGKKSSDSSGGDFEYDEMKKLPITPHDVPEAYVPNVMLPPMSPLPVLQSTIGDAYEPSFFYDAFTNLPVTAHGVPSAVMIAMMYANMVIKDVVKHNVAEAAQYVLDIDAKELLDVTPHDVDDPYVPDLTLDAKEPLPVEPHDVPDAYEPALEYDAKEPLPVEPHNVPDPYVPVLDYDKKPEVDVAPRSIVEAYFPHLLEMTQNQRDRLMNSISVTVISTLTLSVAEGRSIDDTKQAIGEAILQMMGGADIPEDRRSELVSKMGDAVFDAVCGDSDVNIVDAMNNMFNEGGYPASKDDMFNAITDIMNGPESVAPFITAERVIKFDVVPSPAPSYITTLLFGEAQPAVPLTMNVNPTAGLTLGGSGAEGINTDMLQAGLRDVSHFSLRMNVVRALGNSVSVPDDISLDAGCTPVINVIPSLGETKVTFENGEIGWQLNGGKDTVLKSAVLNFSTVPSNLNVGEKAALKHEALSNIDTAVLKMPEVYISVI